MRNAVLNRVGALVLALAGFALAAGARGDVGTYYREFEQNGRVYVFSTQSGATAFARSGEMGDALTFLGAAVGGKTLVAENDQAAELYFAKHHAGSDAASVKRSRSAAAADGGGNGGGSAYPKTKIIGRAYVDFSDKENKDKGTDTHSKDSGIGTDVKRFYFGANHDFDDIWSAQFVADIGDQGTKRYDVFVKKAFVQAKFSDAAIFRIGSTDMPWIPFVEGVYGMRYVENTLIDALSFGTSADWGLHLLGTLADGTVGYQVSAVNGKGYSNPTRTKSVDFEGRISFVPVKGFTLAVGGYTGKLGNDVKDASPALHTASRIDALAAYSVKEFGVGVEYFSADNFKNVTTAATDKADGFSVFAHVGLGGDSKIFARYDSAKPSKDLNSDLKFDYYNLGIEHRFNKSVAGSIVYKYAQVKNGTVATSNGTIGSTVAGQKGDYNEIGVFAVYDF